MKRLITFACCAGLVAVGPAIPGFANQQSETAPAAPRPTSTGNTFCRNPSPLPDLGIELERQITDTPVSGVRAETERVSPPLASSVSADRFAGDSVVVTGTRTAKPSSEETGSLPARISPRPPQPQPQSGLLTAGEHDDLLNPELYEDYRRKSNLGQDIQNLPMLDTGRLLTVELRDRKGRSVPFAEIELRCSDGNSINLKTVADGRVVFFPELDRLSEDVWIRADGGNWRSVRLSSDPGGQTVKITQRKSAAKVDKLDLALVVDVTGSMSDELSYLQTELTTIISELETRHQDLDVRVAFTFYRDKGDAFVTRTFDFDSDLDRAQTRFGQQSANGGGDYPEAMQDALVRAAQMDWRDDAVKTVLLVADAPPHNQDVGLTWLATEHLRAERVHVVPVGASGVADLAEYVMRASAAVTQSRYTFLTDDSGIGNPHAAPAVDCYLVTRLDHLLRRVIDSQLSGRRIEPKQSEVIRRVGDYDAGRCVLPAGFAKGQTETGEDSSVQ